MNEKCSSIFNVDYQRVLVILSKESILSILSKVLWLKTKIALFMANVQHKVLEKYKKEMGKY